MKITVVICTYRRPDSLARTLASIATAKPPLAPDWGVMVVDNANCPRTQRIARSFADRLPVEVMVEPKAGLSHARNTAVANLDCDYSIWTDDDVAVSSNWLCAYETAFAAHPDAAFFGGPIVPEFEGKPPAWLKSALPLIETAFAACDHTGKTKDGRLGLKHLPFGANMAIRKHDLESLRFDASRGRQPGHWLLSGEESQLLRQVCQGGGFGAWVPDAPVTHWIDAKRQTIAYLRQYFEGRAIVEARAALAQSAQPGASTLPLYRELIRAELEWQLGWLRRDPETWVEALYQASHLHATLAARRERLRHGHHTKETGH